MHILTLLQCLWSCVTQLYTTKSISFSSQGTRGRLTFEAPTNLHCCAHNLTCIHLRVAGSAGAKPSCRRAEAGLHPGLAASSSQGHVEDKQSFTLVHLRPTHLVVHLVLLSVSGEPENPDWTQMTQGEHVELLTERPQTFGSNLRPTTTKHWHFNDTWHLFITFPSRQIWLVAAGLLTSSVSVSCHRVTAG